MCVCVALIKAAQLLTQDQQKEGCLWPQLVLCTSVVSFWTTLTYSKPLMYYFYISCCVAFCCRAQPDHSLLLCFCPVFISCSGDFSVTFPLMHHQEGKNDDNNQEIDKTKWFTFPWSQWRSLLFCLPSELGQPFCLLKGNGRYFQTTLSAGLRAKNTLLKA